MVKALLLFTLLPFMAVAPQTIKKEVPRNYKDARITLGYFCPVGGGGPKMIIEGNGAVTYTLEQGRKKEEKKFNISEQKVRELIDQFYGINFFSLENLYEVGISEGCYTEIGFSMDREAKSITVYSGAEPEQLSDLITKVGEISTPPKTKTGPKKTVKRNQRRRTGRHH